jgi:hypothetical protein
MFTTIIAFIVGLYIGGYICNFCKLIREAYKTEDSFLSTKLGNTIEYFGFTLFVSLFWLITLFVKVEDI